ncbi:MAG: glycosyltransferase family 4 protein [Bdellovibrionota bacterium]|nr:glycosyltransferase family 4 protein [Bdellovibrionota bacterium]
MRVLLLADSNSIHTFKIATMLSSKGNDVSIFTLSQDTSLDEQYQERKINIRRAQRNVSPDANDLSKIGYLFSVVALNQYIKEIKPDIVNAHYASSYGLLASIVKPFNFVLNLWGSDVYVFPKKSFFHKFCLKLVLFSSKKINSTSESMANEIRKYTNKEVRITPFGIDLKLFYSERNVFDSDTYNIGLVKGMDVIYGIDILIKAFAIVKRNNPTKNLYLNLYGKGKDLGKFKNLVSRLNLTDTVFFKGFIKNTEVRKAYNKMDLAVFPSRSESFGVSVIEAMACEVPVIVSNVGGLAEVVAENGIILNSNDEKEISNEIQRIIENPKAIETKIKAARSRVERNFSWEVCVERILDSY